MSVCVVSFLNSLVFAFYCFFVGNIILQKKKINVKKIVFAFIPFFIMYYCVLCLLDSIYSIFFSALCAFWFIKIVFCENIYMSLFISLVIHTAKIIFKTIILGLLNKKTLLLINTYKTLNWDAFYINIFAIFLSIGIIILLKKPLRKLIKYVSSLRSREIILLIITYFNFILVLVIQPPHNLFSLQTVTDWLVIFVLTGIGIFNISSEMKTESLTKHYQEIFEYSKTNEQLLNNYKMQVHENKNRLLMINGMLDGPKKEVKEYIKELLAEMNDDKSTDNYWLTELRYINLTGVRNFINYKLRQLKDLGAEIEVFVCSELQKINVTSLSDKEYNQLTTILGVILDNMIESVTNTEEKLISINLYIENNEIHGEFVNTFSGEIDLKRLNEIGYTTKGEQHGVGLPLVAKITKTNTRFQCQPSIMDNFFIQHLTIKIWDKRNLQKMSKK